MELHLHLMHSLKKSFFLLLHSKQFLMNSSPFFSIFIQSLHHILQDVEVSLHLFIKESCNGGFRNLTWWSFHHYVNEKNNFNKNSQSFQKQLIELLNKMGVESSSSSSILLQTNSFVLQGFPWGPLGRENGFKILSSYPLLELASCSFPFTSRKLKLVSNSQFANS